MNPAHAVQHLNYLFGRHRLKERGWGFFWGKARRRAGYTVVSHSGSLKRIIISRPVVELNDEQAVRELLAHEVAHAISYENGNGLRHNPEWAAVARQLGGWAATLVKPVMVMPRGKYRYRCPECKTRTERSRKVKDGYRIGCRKCRTGKGVWVALEEVKR